MTVKNRKAKGTRNERRSMAIFEREDFVTIRAGGSLGVFDFIAIGRKGIILCQVKTRDWPGKAEMRAIYEFPTPPTEFVNKVVHRWRDRERVPDVKWVEMI